MQKPIEELRFFVKVYDRGVLYILSKTPIKKLEHALKSVFPLGSFVHIFPENNFSHYAEGCLRSEIIDDKLTFCLLDNPDTKIFLSLDEFFSKIPAEGCYMILKKIMEHQEKNMKIVYRNAVGESREAVFPIYCFPKNYVDQIALAKALIKEKFNFEYFEIVKAELVE